MGRGARPDHRQRVAVAVGVVVQHGHGDRCADLRDDGVVPGARGAVADGDRDGRGGRAPVTVGGRVAEPHRPGEARRRVEPHDAADHGGRPRRATVRVPRDRDAADAQRVVVGVGVVAQHVDVHRRVVRRRSTVVAGRGTGVRDRDRHGCAAGAAGAVGHGVGERRTALEAAGRCEGDAVGTGVDRDRPAGRRLGDRRHDEGLRRTGDVRVGVVGQHRNADRRAERRRRLVVDARRAAVAHRHADRGGARAALVVGDGVGEGVVAREARVRRVGHHAGRGDRDGAVLRRVRTGAASRRPARCHRWGRSRCPAR